MHDAVSRGSLAETQKLVSEEPKKKLAIAKDPAGTPLLHKAVYHDHQDIVEWLAHNFPIAVQQKDKVIFIIRSFYSRLSSSLLSFFFFFFRITLYEVFKYRSFYICSLVFHRFKVNLPHLYLVQNICGRNPTRNSLPLKLTWKYLLSFLNPSRSG